MADKLPKTIQFFLPEGEPRGTRIADITTRTVQAVPMLHSKLAEAAKRICAAFASASTGLTRQKAFERDGALVRSQPRAIP